MHHLFVSILQDGGDDDNDGEGGDKRSTRPTTARRRPPKVKDGAKELQSKDVAPAVKKTEGIIIDGQADEVRVSFLFLFCCRSFCRVVCLRIRIFCVLCVVICGHSLIFNHDKSFDNTFVLLLFSLG